MTKTHLGTLCPSERDPTGVGEGAKGFPLVPSVTAAPNERSPCRAINGGVDPLCGLLLGDGKIDPPRRRFHVMSCRLVDVGKLTRVPTDQTKYTLHIICQADPGRQTNSVGPEAARRSFSSLTTRPPRASGISRQIRLSAPDTFARFFVWSTHMPI